MGEQANPEKITRRHSERTASVSPSSRSAVLVFDCVGFENEQEIINHAEYPYEINDSYPNLDGELVCSSIDINTRGHRSFVMRVAFSTPPRGFTKFQESRDETGVVGASKLSIVWALKEAKHPIDRDVDDNPIVNSAGQVMDPPSTKTIHSIVVTMERVEDNFDVGTAMAHVDHINENVFLGAAAYTVRCQNISPVGTVSNDDEQLRVKYVFEFRDTDVWGSFPWHARRLDEGTMATWALRKADKLHTATGELVQAPVALDGKGVPINTTEYSLKPGDFFPQPGPPRGARTQENFNRGNRTGGVWLLYQVDPISDFDALGLA